MGLIIYDKSGGYTGWLGNFMFQTASTIGIAKKNNMECTFPYKKYFGCFNHSQELIHNIQHLTTKDLQENGFEYQDIILDNKMDYNLRGYFQSYKYFEHCQGLVRKEFTFNKGIKSRCELIIKETRQLNPGRFREVQAIRSASLMQRTVRLPRLLGVRDDVLDRIGGERA